MSKKPKLFKLNENVIKNLTIEQVAVYAVIANAKTSDNSCYCYIDYIANKLGCTPLAIKNQIKGMNTKGAFTITKERVTGEKIYRNRYTFTNLDKHFILADSTILDDLNKEEIGFIFKLKTLCLDNSLTNKMNKKREALGKLMGIGKARVKRIIDGLVIKGVLTLDEEKITIIKYFQNTQSKKESYIKKLESLSKITGKTGSTANYYLMNADQYSDEDLARLSLSIETGLLFKKDRILAPAKDHYHITL